MAEGRERLQVRLLKSAPQLPTCRRGKPTGLGITSQNIVEHMGEPGPRARRLVVADHVQVDHVLLLYPSDEMETPSISK